jgi:hypothetical protein
MSTYKKVIQDLFSSINNVKVNKTVISEPDIVEFKIGKDHFQLTTDELSDASIFIKKYIKAKGILLPEFTDIEWVGFIETLYRRAEFCEALEFSDAVFTGKLFIDKLYGMSSTTVAAKAYDILLEKDGFLYFRYGALYAWLINANPTLGIAEFSRILVELGAKTPGNKRIPCGDETRLFWEFKRLR